MTNPRGFQASVDIGPDVVHYEDDNVQDYLEDYLTRYMSLAPREVQKLCPLITGLDDMDEDWDSKETISNSIPDAEMHPLAADPSSLPGGLVSGLKFPLPEGSNPDFTLGGYSDFSDTL